jgi:hypothetical protein
MDFPVYADVAFNNTSRRDSVVGNVQTRLEADPTVTSFMVSTGFSHPAHDPSMFVVARFTNAADQLALYTDAQAAFGTGVNGPVSGSKIWMHVCRHDEDIGSCTVSDQVDY